MGRHASRTRQMRKGIGALRFLILRLNGATGANRLQIGAGPTSFASAENTSHQQGTGHPQYAPIRCALTKVDIDPGEDWIAGQCGNESCLQTLRIGAITASSLQRQKQIDLDPASEVVQQDALQRGDLRDV